MSDLLLKVTAQDLTQIGELDGPPYPGGWVDDEPMTMYWGVEPSPYWIAGSVGVATEPSDTPPNETILAAIAAPLSHQISLFSGVDPLSPGSASAGFIEIIDPNGDLDWIVNLGWDDATIQLLQGDMADGVASLPIAGTLTGAGIEYNGETKRIAVRDLRWQLEQAPLHDIRYAGTGGYEGDEGLANVIRLIAFGPCSNITPKLLVANSLIYEVSCTSVFAITAVRHGGIALTPGADFATYALLAAATVGAGTFATCLALGLFRISFTPEKDITADVTGDNDTIDGFTRPITRGQIARRIATGRGKLKLTTAQLDAASFTALDAAQPGACECFWDREVSKADALDEIMKGILGDWSFGLEGMLSVGFTDEIPDASDLSLTVQSGVEGEVQGDYAIMSEPVMETASASRQATYLGYAKNYTVQDRGALLDGVTAEDIALYGQESRYVSAINLAIAAARPSAPIVKTDSHFAEESVAETECIRQQSVMEKRRERWRVLVSMSAFTAVLRLIMSVERWGRYTFGPIRRLRCVGMKADVENEVTLDLWG